MLQTLSFQQCSIFKGFVTPIRHQGECNTCVAFAFTALLESCLLKAGANMMGLNLSEQAFLDCDETNVCKTTANISTYINLFSTKLQGRFLLESKYKYRGNKTSDCPKNVEWYNPGAEVEAIYTVGDCNEDKLKEMVIFLLNIMFINFLPYFNLSIHLRSHVRDK